MQSILCSIKGVLAFNNFPVLTVLANVSWGYALGKILATPGDEVGGSFLIKALLIVGTCLFANYLLCLRKAFQGVNRTVNGKLRPLLREARRCAALNVLILVVSLTLFFLKSHFF